MPNTVTPKSLRSLYVASYGESCTLNTSTVQFLWRSTGDDGRSRGRNVTRETLEARANRTVELMHEKRRA